MTLKVLQELLPRECLRERLHVFVSHDDPHFVAGCYEKALGEELKARIIVGVTGADLQAEALMARSTVELESKGDAYRLCIYSI